MGLFSPSNQSTYGGNKGPNKIMVFAIAGVAGIVLIIMLILIIGWLNGTGRQDLITTSARMSNLQTMVGDATKKLRSADFMKLNSDSTVLIASDAAAISTNLARKYNVKKLDKEALTKATNTADTKALSEAELVNQYDITYRQILRKNIASTLTAARAARANNSDRQIQAALDTTVTNLNNLDKRLSELNL